MQTTHTHTFAMTIGGRDTAAQEMFDVVDPSTGEAFERAPACSAAQLDAAMEAASRALSSWRQDASNRRRVLMACAAAIQPRARELAGLLTREQGKPLARAAAEIASAVRWLKYTATLEVPVEVPVDNERLRVEVRRRPLGVVAAITPWNYPVSLAIWKIAPALLAGNTIVVKPSPFTPLTTLKLGEILRKVVPAGVLNVVSGGAELGTLMVQHPAVRKISFTGSVATGKKVAAAAATDLKRVTLELGGNDPAIVLPDAEPAAVAGKLLWGAFENCGQVCTAIKRLYVPEPMYAALVRALGDLAGRVKVGPGLDPASEMGPINNRSQFDRICELVDDAKRNGATIVAGGRPRGRGYFYEPTVVSDISDGTRLVDEEQFGPVLPIVPYRDLDDAIERANGTHYGLGASVWSSDRDRAIAVASRLESGTAWVNQHQVILPNVPFGGAKWSGIGVENGPWGLLGFTEIQTINIAKGSV